MSAFTRAPPEVIATFDGAVACLTSYERQTMFSYRPGICERTDVRLCLPGPDHGEARPDSAVRQPRERVVFLDTWAPYARPTIPPRKLVSIPAWSAIPSANGSAIVTAAERASARHRSRHPPSVWSRPQSGGC